MVDKALDQLFIDFLLDNFKEELRHRDIASIFKNYSAKCRANGSAFAAAFEKKVPGSWHLEDPSYMFLYFWYIFKEYLDFDIFKAEHVLSQFAVLDFNLNFPIPESYYMDIHIDCQHYKNEELTNLNFRGKFEGAGIPTFILENIPGKVLSNDIFLFLANVHSPIQIILPENLERINDDFFMESTLKQCIEKKISLLFHPKNDKVGFLIPRAQAEYYKKILKPIK